jgi:ArsR family transcriptional regulator, arsenate/arsenite/antimonite-responsive transcriptional repressor
LIRRSSGGLAQYRMVFECPKAIHGVFIVRAAKNIVGHYSILLLYWKYISIGVEMKRSKEQPAAEQIMRYAEMFSAIGNDARLRIMRLLLSAHPDGMIVGDVQSELGIPNSTLSHHLDKLKNEGLVKVRREGTFLWYMANTEALGEILAFLYSECCTRNKAIDAGSIVQLCESCCSGKPAAKDSD